MKKGKGLEYSTFDDFYNQNYDSLVWYVSSVLKSLKSSVEDVVQETFFTLFKKDQWKKSHARFLLFRAAKNRAIDTLRLKKPIFDISNLIYTLEARSFNFSENVEFMEEKERWNKIAQSCLSDLQYRVYFFLVHRSFSVDQISKEIGKPKEKVRIYISLIRKKLKKYRR